MEIVYISAPWCAPCRILGPIVEEVSKERNIPVTKINAQDAPAMVEVYNVSKVPVLVFVKDGIEVGRHTGAISKHQLISLIENFF